MSLPEPKTDPVPLDYERPAVLPAPEAYRRPLMVLFVIVLVDLMGFGLVLPLLPVWVERYKVSPMTVMALGSAYSLCQLIASPVLGSLSDRYGRRPVLFLSQVGSCVGFVILGMVALGDWVGESAVMWAVGWIYVSRVIDGLSAGNISTAHAYIGDVVPKARRGAAMGMLGAAFGIGFAAGPVVGGLLGERLAAFAAAGAAALAAALTIAMLPESRTPGTRAAAISRNRFGLAGVIEVLGRPTLGQLTIIGFVCMVAYVMMEASIALYLASPRTFAFDMKHVGWYLGAVGVVIIITQGALAGPLIRRYGEWALTAAGPLLVAAAMLAYCLVPGWPALGLLGLAGLLNAVGRSIYQPAILSLVSKGGGDEQGATFGVFQGVMALARVIGPLLAGLLYERNLTLPFAVAGVMVLAAGVWVLVLRGRLATPAQAGG